MFAITEHGVIPYLERLLAWQALVNADKLHLLSDRERRKADKLLKQGLILPKGYSRLC
jgi:hypothetical protein